MTIAAQHDRVARGLGPGAAQPVALEDRVLDLVERQSALRAQLGGHPDLGIDDAVGGEVLGALGRDPDDRVTLLHHARRVGEGLEIELQALAVGAPPDPGGQLVGVSGREPVVAVLRGEIDDRGRAQAAVEVVVQEGLGGRADRLERQHALDGTSAGVPERHRPTMGRSPH